MLYIHNVLGMYIPDPDPESLGLIELELFRLLQEDQSLVKNSQVRNKLLGLL